MNDPATNRTTDRSSRFLMRSWGPIAGPINYEFLDRSVIREHGVVASLEIVQNRFDAFKAIRPWEPEV